MATVVLYRLLCLLASHMPLTLIWNTQKGHAPSPHRFGGLTIHFGSYFSLCLLRRTMNIREGERNASPRAAAIPNDISRSCRGH